ncbi:MAG: glycoside hydrolase domain-containing protein [Victivallaceae bacterium]
MKMLSLISLVFGIALSSIANERQNGAPVSFSPTKGVSRLQVESGKNLAKNGNFTNGLKGWNAIFGEKAKADKENFITTGKIDGQPSSTYAEINIKSQGYAALLQSIKLQEKSLYKMSFRYKVEEIYNHDKGRFGVEIKVYDHENDIIQLDYPCTTRQPSEWKEATTFLYVPVNTHSLTFKPYCRESRTLISDVVVEKINIDTAHSRDELNQALNKYGKPFISVNTNEDVTDAAQSHGFCLFSTSTDELVVQSADLKGKKVISSLRGFGSPGEKISLNLHVLADKNLTISKIDSSKLENGANIIPADNLIFKRVAFIKKHKMYVWPDKQQLMPIPLEDWSPIILNKSLGSIWIDVKIPEKTVAGIYKGAITLQTSAGNINLPVGIKVFAVKLPESSSKIVGTWYSVRAKGNDWQQQHKDMKYADYVNAFKDMKSHGNESVVIDPTIKFKFNGNKLAIDFSHAEMILKAISEARLNGPIIFRTQLMELAKAAGSKDITHADSGSSLINNAKYQQGVKEYVNLIYKYFPREKNVQVYFVDMDEISKYGKNVSTTWKNIFAPLKQQFPEQKIFLSVPAGNPEMNGIIDEQLNVKCFGGQGVDVLMCSPDYNFDKFVKDENDNGQDELWVYYNRGIIFQTLPKFQRLMNGIWLWHTPFKGNLPWAYQDMIGNPYDYIERAKPKERDINYTYPSIGKPPISTYSWEAMANGINDVKYLDVLNSIAHSSSPEAAKAKELLGALANYVRDCRVTLVLLDNETSPEMIDRLEWAMACIAEAGQKK